MTKIALTFADLFAGIGGIRIGFEKAGCQCVFSNDSDRFCKQTYIENFGTDDFVCGDRRRLSTWQLPNFDTSRRFPLPAVFGSRSVEKKSLGQPHGFEDETQGTLFSRNSARYQRQTAAGVLPRERKEP